MTTSVTALTIPPWLTERGIIAPPSGGKRHRSRQELYDELRNALSEAIREGDRDALNGFIESEVLYHIAPADIPSLWDLCWESWRPTTPHTRIALGTFMAIMKGIHLALPPFPEWIAAIDPETAESLA